MKKVVFIRAGHSGVDPNTGEYLTKKKQNAKYFLHRNGKPYHDNGYFYEGVSNRNIADKVMKFCQERAIEFEKLHHDYQDFYLSTFCLKANKLYHEYRAKGYDVIMLDIHSNAGGIRGFSAFYYPGYIDANGRAVKRPSTNGLKLATVMANSINPLFLMHKSELKYPIREGWMYKRNGTGYIPYAVYYMLKETAMPTVILENGFFDNAADADLLMDENFTDALAECIVNGIEKYFEQKEIS